MNFIEFKNELYKRSEELDFEERRTLEIQICKRLFPYYKAFHNQSCFGNPDVLMDIIRFVESGDNQIKRIHMYLDALEEVTPDTEDFEECSYALNACEATRGLLLQIAEPSQTELFIETAMAYFDTMDAKVQEGGLSEDEINKHPLMIDAKNFILH
jgi:uncharacterized protein